MDLIRAFNAELVYVRTPFPMGKKGLMVKDGEVTPNGEELQQMMALYGDRLSADRLPSSDMPEVTLSEEVARARGIGIGGLVGSDVDELDSLPTGTPG